MDAQNGTRLTLEIDDRRVELRAVDAASGQTLLLGTEPDNDLVCGAQFTSRCHARVELRHSSYYLVDQSTNGTFVQTDDEQVRYVHRAAVRLWGGGWIALGEPLHSAEPIRFIEALG